MIDINDSSFESGSLVGTKWANSANIQLRKYEDWLGKPPSLYPNVEAVWFAYLTASGTYTCGLADPNQYGIPVATWTKARMGIHAFKPSATAVNITLGVKLYNHLGVYLRDVTILSSRPITEEWAWYGSPDASAVDLGQTGFAYAVPWVQVSNPCSIDLLVVDDG